MLLKGSMAPTVQRPLLERSFVGVAARTSQHQHRRVRHCVLARAEAPTDNLLPEQDLAPAPADAPAEKLGWWQKETSSNIRDCESVQQLVDELADAGDKLVIVEFYAPWCNACKALYPKLCRLMAEHEDDILFLKISFEANKDICKTMGVKVLPYFHFYRGSEGRVDQFSCTISKIQRFKDAVETHSSAFCSLSDPPGVEEFPEIKAHTHYAHHGHGPNGIMTVADRPTDLNSIAWS